MISDATRAALDAKPSPPLVPTRFRDPLYHVIDKALPEDWGREVGRWLYEHRDRLVAYDEGETRFGWDLPNLDRLCPDLVIPLKRRLIEAAGATDVLDACVTPAFDLRYLEVHGSLYHHGGHHAWHDDVPGIGGLVIPSRRLSFAYFMHSDPKMFSGGDLEFLDGTTVEPKNDRLILFHPAQQHRIRSVECWSSALLHGRWALTGWIHGDPPDGWVERLPKLRGVP